MLVMIFIFPVFLLFLPTNRGCAPVDVHAWMCAFSHGRLNRFETSQSWKVESARRLVSKGDWKDDSGEIIYVCGWNKREEVFFINKKLLISRYWI